jgi:hypothetical protein
MLIGHLTNFDEAEFHQLLQFGDKTGILTWSAPQN